MGRSLPVTVSTPHIVLSESLVCSGVKILSLVSDTRAWDISDGEQWPRMWKCDEGGSWGVHSEAVGLCFKIVSPDELLS